MNQSQSARTVVLPGHVRIMTLNGWVPVVKSLPEEDGAFLVYDGLEMYQARFWKGLNSLPYFYTTDEGHRPYVTHWQPLPEKP